MISCHLLYLVLDCMLVTAGTNIVNSANEWADLNWNVLVIRAQCEAIYLDTACVGLKPVELYDSENFDTYPAK